MNKQQLANRIWASANNMRNKIDANEYKDYILGLIFYKFLSDTEVKCLKEKLGWDDEDLSELKEDYENPDMKNVIEECQKRIGFFIEYKYLFNAWVKNDSEQTENRVEFNVAVLSEALSNFDRLMSDNYKSVYTGIFKTLREGLSKLGDNPSAQTKALKSLIKLIKDIPTDGSQDYDVLGYVYEYLISNFAASAGKKAGEFYTPHEVAMIMSEIVAEHHKDKESIEIYDPTSGSGSLLITIGKAVGKHITGANKVKYFAQELKENTYNLTRMNLVMRGIIPANIVTRCADTLEEDWPMHEEGIDIDKPLAVDAVVSNPPYSQHWDDKDKELDPRFANYGVAPKTKADYAFLLHELHHLKNDGILSIVLPHGVLFRGKTPKIYDENGDILLVELRDEGQAEGKIRANLIEKNNIDAIIGLPAGIFFGTGIPTIIMVLKKNRGDEGVLIIDASKGFVKDGKQNRLRACDVKKISDTYRERKSTPGFSRVVTRDEIRRNDYNLNIPRYVDSSEASVKYDIYSTMFGGIPNNEITDMSKYWDAFSSLQQELFAPETDRPYSTIKVDKIAECIQANSDVKKFKQDFATAFASFKDLLHMRLVDHVEDVKEMEESDLIANDIFYRIGKLPLVDKYAAYQILADNWSTIMGDIEIIQTEGFGACNVVEEKKKMVKDKNGVEQEVSDGLKGRIMPFELVQNTYLTAELEALNLLNQKKEEQDSILAEIVENLDADEQEMLLNDDNTKLDSKSLGKAWMDICLEHGFVGNKKKLTDAFNAYTFEEDSTEDKIKHIMDAQAKSSALKKEITSATAALEQHTVETIETLDMKQINYLLDLKWILPITLAIDAMPDVVLDTLADSVSKLNEKYAVTYSDIEAELKESQDTLAELVGQLTGDEFAIRGLNELINGGK